MNQAGEFPHSPDKFAQAFSRAGVVLATHFRPDVSDMQCAYFPSLARPWSRLISALLLILSAGCFAPDRASVSALDALEVSQEIAAPLTMESLDHARLGAAIFAETNRVRREMHLPPFASLPPLDHAADVQASTNSLTGGARHSNVVLAWSTPADRVQSAGLGPGNVAENVASLPLLNLDPAHGYIERESENGREILDAQTNKIVEPHTYASFAKAIVEAWMNSPAHRQNIVKPTFQFLGCSGRPGYSVRGLAMVSCTQVFYTPAR